MGDLSGVYYREVPGVDRPASHYSIRLRLARIIHDGSSAPTLPSPIAWGRVREEGRDRRAEPCPCLSRFSRQSRPSPLNQVSAIVAETFMNHAGEFEMGWFVAYTI